MKSPKPVLLLLVAAVLLGTAGVVGAHPSAPPAFKLRVFAGAPSASAFGPDDIAWLNGHVYVGWQNGVGTMGEAAPKTGNTNSLVVEYGHGGKPIGRWSVKGKVDGLGGYPARHAVIATVNEDGNSSLYLIRPGRSAHHYTYSPSPDKASKGPLLTGGGTDSVIAQGNKLLIAASAPTRKGRTATFWVTLRGSRAVLHPTFADNARATDALTGASVRLHVTDPDSNAVVPRRADVFGGDYMLDGQADQELIFAHGIGSGHVSLQRLQLFWGLNGKPAGVDDVRWARSNGQTLYVVDNGANKIYTIRGLEAGDVMAAMDTIGTKSAGSTVATLNTGDGELDPLFTGFKTVKGLLFAP
jgi:hypothetical protein